MRAQRAAVAMICLALAGCGPALARRAVATTASAGAPTPSAPAAPPAENTVTAARWTPLPAAPEPVPDHVTAVVALSPKVLVGATPAGVWRSPDAGRTWRRTLAFRTAADWSYVGRAGAGVAVLVDGERVYLSADGKAWHSTTVSVADPPSRPSSLGYVPVLFNGTGPTAVGLAWGSPTHAGAVDGGPLQRTTDGGRHWTPVAGTDDVDDVDFAPDGRTVVVSETRFEDAHRTCPTTLLRSTDAGADWSYVPALCAGIGPVTFTDDLHAFTDATPRLATSDGGRVWREQPAGAPLVRVRLRNSCFVDADNPCYGQVLRTTDGGATWHDTGRTTTSLTSYGVTVLLAGGGQTPPGITLSHDGGSTWTREVPQADIAVRHLAGTAGDLVAVTNDGAATSNDAGHTWKSLHLPVRTSFAAPAAAPAGAATLLLSDQGVRRTTDAGRTWPTAPVPKGTQFLSDGSLAVDDTDPLRAVAIAQPSSSTAGCASVVLVTTDGGRHWRRQRNVPGGVSGGIGYDGNMIVTPAGCASASSVVLSTDGGRTWQLEDPASELLVSSAGAAGGTLWVAGFEPVTADRTSTDVVVALSTDAGATWQEHVLTGFRADPYTGFTPTVVGLSATAAVVSMGDDTLWRTADSGASWRQERPSLPHP